MRACRFSSVMSGARPANTGASARVVAADHVADRNGLEPDAERARQLVGVVERVARGVLGRHRDADHVRGPERVDGDRGGQRRIDAAREPEHHGLEAVLGHVVARAEHERGVDLRGGLERRRRRPARRARRASRRRRRRDALAATPGTSMRGSGPVLVERALLAQPRVVQAGVEHLVEVEVGDHQVLGEHRALGEHLRRARPRSGWRRRRRSRPGRRPGSRSRPRRGCPRRACAIMRRRSPALPRVIGRGREVDDHLGAAAHHLLLDRAAGDPDVLADVDAERDLAAAEHARLRARR